MATGSLGNMTASKNGPMIKSTISYEGDFLLGSTITTIALFSFTLNGLVIITIAKKGLKRNKLRIYIFNVCVACFIPSVASYPLPAISSFRHGWVFGHLACSRDAFTVYYFAMVVICQLMIISIWRYVKTCHSHIEQKFGYRWVLASVAWTYIYAMVWALPPFFGWGSYSVEPFGTACSLEWTKLPSSYLTAIFIFCFIVPLITLVYCYGAMVVYIRANTSPGSLVTHHFDTYMTKVAFVLCASYMTAWVPYSVISFLVAFTDVHITPELSAIPSIFAKSSTVYNPIIYYFMIRSFREETVGIIAFWHRNGNCDLHTPLQRILVKTGTVMCNNVTEQTNIQIKSVSNEDTCGYL